MTKDDFLSNYEMALTELAIAKVKVKLLKIKLKFQIDGPITRTNSRKKPSKKEQSKNFRNPVEEFIESHPDLEPEDIEFLRSGECTVADVAKYLNDNSIIEIHRDTIGRKIGSWYRPGPNDSPGKRTIDPISVIERHFYPD
jgi:hypothetical protein